ncbi:biotin/lipoyl-binding protein [candidate division WOR-3 bacterium]|nr:biotin/lipoyl-binding protein [candidate division WOR-3 bacterium]
MAYLVRTDGREFKVDIRNAEEGLVTSVNGERIDVAIIHAAGNRLMLIVNNEPFSIILESDRRIIVNAETYDVDLIDERIPRLMSAGTGAVQKREVALKAVMPGLVVEVNVKPGDTVRAGAGLLVVEAMKMQNELKSSRDGCVKIIHVQPGQTVNTGDTLITIE